MDRFIKLSVAADSGIFALAVKYDVADQTCVLPNPRLVVPSSTNKNEINCFRPRGCIECVKPLRICQRFRALPQTFTTPHGRVCHATRLLYDRFFNTVARLNENLSFYWTRSSRRNVCVTRTPDARRPSPARLSLSNFLLVNSCRPTVM